MSTAVGADTVGDVKSTVRYRIVIVGGGAAGISVASRLRNAGESDIAVIDPATRHYYQPAWTLVGGGLMAKERTVRSQRSVIPKGVTWIAEAATGLDPDHNRVELGSGRAVEYDYLVVCPGIALDWDRVEGLESTLGTNGVSSNYRYDLCEATWENIRTMRDGGTAIFTFPAGPIKCAGAPQKIMYLAADYWRKHGTRVNIVYATATPAIFGVPTFAKPLMGVAQRYGCDLKFSHNLVAIDGPRKEATFELVADPAKPRVTMAFDMIHVTPPQSAPAFVKGSSLAETEGPQKGYVAVDKHTLRSPKYSNVFALGDAGSTPNSKTAAAIRKQAPIVAANLLAAMNDRSLPGSYDGYASCPLVTGYGKLIMAEFDYDGNPTPTFPLDPTKERWSMYMIKRHLLAPLYWNLMLKGLA